MDKEYAIKQLKTLVPKNTTVYTAIKHVSRSGMSRTISCYVVSKGEIVWIDGYIEQAGIANFNKNHEGLNIRGCGMDMGFHLVNNLSYALYGTKNGMQLKHRWI